jgi:hypothetical protein
MQEFFCKSLAFNVHLLLSKESKLEKELSYWTEGMTMPSWVRADCHALN